jgi:1-acyl-sn-glycerol-3-phosphate acyltransferase
MEQWQFEPARDLGLTRNERRLSLRREVGLEGAISSLLWRTVTRFYLALAHRLSITGRENLPSRPPFVLVANHSSHLDAVVLGAMLPARFAGTVFPVAAGDTFFTKRATSIFATACMNALPIWRRNCGAHSLEELRARFLEPRMFTFCFRRARGLVMARWRNSSQDSVASWPERTYRSCRAI